MFAMCSEGELRRFGKKRQSRFYRVYAKQFRGDASGREINASVEDTHASNNAGAVYKQTGRRRLSFVACDGLSSSEIVRCFTLLSLLHGLHCSSAAGTDHSHRSPPTIALIASR